MGKRKAGKASEIDTDVGFDNDMEFENINVDSDDELNDDHDIEDGDTGDDYGDDNENESGNEEEEEEEEEEEGDDESVEKAEEMQELEKEYLQLRNEELDILRNLKRNKDEDFQRGQAVKNQRALWDKTLEFRFSLQKCFSSSNRLPQESAKSLFCETDVGISEAYSALMDSSKKTLDSILELQQALIDNNPSTSQSSKETAFYALKRLQPKKRKIVDRRASKSRKIRYNVHEKIVNFMAPRPMNHPLPSVAPKLFENLFGLKTASVA